MLRSIAIARASLARSAGSKLCSLQNQSQVLTKTVSPKPYPSHFSSTSAFPANHSLQDPRYFSHSSLDHSELELEEESRSDDNSDLGSPGVHKVDGNDKFGETQVEVSLEPEGLGLGLDESAEGESREQENEIDAEKLEQVLSLLQSSVDGSLESNLNGLELGLTEEFVLTVLEAPLVPGGHLIRFFRWTMENKEFRITTTVLDALVRGVCQNVKRNDAYALWDLIKEIGEMESGLLNAEILNVLISLFSKLGKGKAGLEVFNKLEELGCVPNADTYYFTIEALCRRSMYSWALEVCNKMLNAGILPDNEKLGQIICFLCRGQKPKEAHLVYLLAKESSRQPPQIAVKFLISALAHVDETVVLALEMLDDFSPEVRKYAIKQFSHVIQGLCRTKNVKGAKELLLKMVEASPPPGNAVFNTVIGSLSKGGDIEEAITALRLMQKRGLKPDVYTYSVIMSGYAKGGLMDEAYKLVQEAKKEHSKLCPTTFHTLIRGYCKIKDYDKALKLLNEMKDYGVQPNVDEYNKLMQSLCLEALDWKRAEKLLEEMKQKGLFLPGITRGLINAVRQLEQEALGNAEGANAEA